MNNQLIKELTGSAKVLAEESINKKISANEELCAFANEFAELIVRECVNCGNVLAAHYIEMHTEKDQAMLLASISDYSSEIKKHFGIEE
jgi:hypothetical protein